MNEVTREEWTIGGLALLIVLDLVLLPFFSVSLGPIDFNLTGTDAPDGWLGVLALLAALAIIADLAVERFSPATTLPAFGGSRGTTRFILAALAAVFVGLKFLFQISHFGDLGYGFWLLVLLCAGLVYVTMQARGGRIVRGAPLA